MSVQSILDSRRHGLVGCNIVAFGDYRSLLVLRSSHEPSIRRETLDDLCSRAASVFGRLDAIALAKGLDQPIQTGATVNRMNTMLFARNGAGESEFICLAGAWPLPTPETFELTVHTLRDVEACA